MCWGGGVIGGCFQGGGVLVGDSLGWREAVEGGALCFD